MRRKSITILLAAAVFALGALGCEPTRHFLHDDQGRELILHGLNVSNAAKGDPLGVGWHTEGDYARMGSWGFNAVRLLIFWSSLEPEEGVFDQAYLDRVAERVGWATTHGLHVILDMHQDVYGKKYGSDGAPSWASRDDGLPFNPCASPWWIKYLQPAVRAAFNHLWDDADLQQHYFDAWALVAERFGENPTVIGYDLMNEPFFGDTNPLTYEETKLLPFYRGAKEAIRAVDPDGVIYFEPMIVTSSGIPSFMPPMQDPDTVYFPHFYQPAVHEGEPYDGNAWLIETARLVRSQEAARHGVPWLLGEFGVAETTEGFEPYMNDLLASLDRSASGWTAWSYDKGGGFCILDSEGNEKANLAPYIRTYPRRVAGRTDSFTYDPASKRFTLTYRNKEGVPGPTEIYVPATRHYGGSFSVTSTDPAGSWSYEFDGEREVLSLHADPESPVHTVRIEAVAGE